MAIESLYLIFLQINRIILLNNLYSSGKDKIQKYWNSVYKCFKDLLCIESAILKLSAAL